MLHSVCQKKLLLIMKFVFQLVFSQRCFDFCDFLTRIGRNQRILEGFQIDRDVVGSSCHREMRALTWQ